MRSPAEAEKIIRNDRRKSDLFKALLNARKLLEERHYCLPQTGQRVLDDLERYGNAALDDITRLAFFSPSALSFDEAREVKAVTAGILGRAYEVDTGVLLQFGPWDGHVSDRFDYFIPDMAALGLFSPLRKGGDVLFLAGGIGEEALELKKTARNDFSVSILEKDPRYALVSLMRGFSLLNGRPTGLDEDWSRGISMDFVFLAFPDISFDFGRIARNIDKALKEGGHAVIVGNLDFAGQLTDYLSAKYRKVPNPLRDGTRIDDEFLQIYLKTSALEK